LLEVIKSNLGLVRRSRGQTQNLSSTAFQTCPIDGGAVACGQCAVVANIPISIHFAFCKHLARLSAS